MGGFFLKVGAIDEKIVSFTYKTYGNALDLLDYDYGFNIIIAGLEDARKEKYWQLYCNLYPLMNEQTFISFENFVKEMTKAPEPKHTKEQILNKVEGILNMSFRKGEA